MSEQDKWRILIVLLFVALLAYVPFATRYSYNKTQTNTIPIFERLDKWTGKVSVTNYVSKKWKDVQTQQLPTPSPQEATEQPQMEEKD